jgi:hypothetical protein
MRSSRIERWLLLQSNRRKHSLKESSDTAKISVARPFPAARASLRADRLGTRGPPFPT